ncbi:MFS transporter [Micrococcales bacterium 31B]|nr:MFS transporter [Micrococcales bacterium 31B]
MNQAPVPIKTLILNTFLPISLYSIGSGAVVPVLAITALALGASPAEAAFIVALTGVGEVVTDIPAGRIVARFGERNTMIGATGLAVAALVGCIVAPNLWTYAICVFLMGSGDSLWDLARSSYLTETIPEQYRARAMSTLGGLGRLGNFAGPLLAAGAIALWSTTAAYLIHVVMCVAACVVLVCVPKTSHDERHQGRERQSLRATFAREKGVLLTVGLGAALVAASRNAKRVAIPLWAASIGLDAGQIALILGISGVLDMLLFYPSGVIMDRFGRMHVVVPSMVGTGLAYLYLPFTHDYTTVLIMAIALGLSNGMAAGIIKTLGADFAPAGSRQVFLGLWNFLGSFGSMAGPLGISGVIAIGGLAAGAALPGAYGLGAAALMGAFIPRAMARRRERSA